MQTVSPTILEQQPDGGGGGGAPRGHGGNREGGRQQVGGGGEESWYEMGEFEQAITELDFVGFTLLRGVLSPAE